MKYTREESLSYVGVTAQAVTLSVRGEISTGKGQSTMIHAEDTYPPTSGCSDVYVAKKMMWELQGHVVSSSFSLDRCCMRPLTVR